MTIKNIFEKKIDRDIRGVIKVDKGIGTTETEISEKEALEKQEIEEYVVTNELQRHFATFFYNYKKGIVDNTDKMGVWISGFFGSGKSHFLKTLAHLLANKEIAQKKLLITLRTIIKFPIQWFLQILNLQQIHQLMSYCLMLISR